MSKNSGRKGKRKSKSPAPSAHAVMPTTLATPALAHLDRKTESVGEATVVTHGK